MRARLSSLVLSTALLSGCVDDVLIGLREPDATIELPQDAEPDPIDVYTGERDAADVDGGVDDGALPDAEVADGGPCDGALCAPQKRLGACHTCDLVVSISQRTCDESGLPEACWDGDDGPCSFQCPNVTSCRASSDCAADEFCFYPHEDCGETSDGYCSRRPDNCSPLAMDACGCDGKMYASGCAAEQAGVPYFGELPPVCQPKP